MYSLTDIMQAGGGGGGGAGRGNLLMTFLIQRNLIESTFCSLMSTFSKTVFNISGLNIIISRMILFLKSSTF